MTEDHAVTQSIPLLFSELLIDMWGREWVEVSIHKECLGEWVGIDDEDDHWTYNGRLLRDTGSGWWYDNGFNSIRLAHHHLQQLCDKIKVMNFMGEGE